MKAIEAAIERLSKCHPEHISQYGTGNEDRLTGKHGEKAAPPPPASLLCSAMTHTTRGCTAARLPTTQAALLGSPRSAFCPPSPDPSGIPPLSPTVPPPPQPLHRRDLRHQHLPLWRGRPRLVHPHPAAGAAGGQGLPGGPPSRRQRRPVSGPALLSCHPASVLPAPAGNGGPGACAHDTVALSIIVMPAWRAPAVLRRRISPHELRSCLPAPAPCPAATLWCGC